MGLFNKLKNRIMNNSTLLHDVQTKSDTQALQKRNDECLKHREEEERSLESKYDMQNADGIMAIPISQKVAQSGSESVTGRLDYYLMMKAGRYEKANEVELALACYRKSNDLMAVSGFPYEKDRYLRLPRYLRKLRRFDEAREEEARIEGLFTYGLIIPDSVEDSYRAKGSARLEQTARQGSDLVEVTSHEGCCETCAKYRGRIFSLNGKNKKFPLFPADFCAKCGLTYFPYYEGMPTTYSRNKGNALIKEMNQPFVDKRTTEEKELYIQMLEQQEIDRQRDQSRKDYEWLWEFLPEICPKSFSGYMRMKNTNSANYQKIVATAKERGYELQ